MEGANNGKREVEKRELKVIPTISCSSSFPSHIEVGPQPRRKVFFFFAFFQASESSEDSSPVARVRAPTSASRFGSPKNA